VVYNSITKNKLQGYNWPLQKKIIYYKGSLQMTLKQIAMMMRNQEGYRVQPQTPEKQEKLNRAFYKYPVVMYNKIKDDLREGIITYREMAVLQEVIFRIIQYKEGRDGLHKEIAVSTFKDVGIDDANVSRILNKLVKIGYLKVIKKAERGSKTGSIYQLNMPYFGSSNLLF